MSNSKNKHLFVKGFKGKEITSIYIDEANDLTFESIYPIELKVDHTRYETYMTWFIDKFLCDIPNLKEDPDYDFFDYLKSKRINHMSNYSGGSTISQPINYATRINTIFPFKIDPI